MVNRVAQAVWLCSCVCERLKEGRLRNVGSPAPAPAKLRINERLPAQ